MLGVGGKLATVPGQFEKILLFLRGLYVKRTETFHLLGAPNMHVPVQHKAVLLRENPRARPLGGNNS